MKIPFMKSQVALRFVNCLEHLKAQKKVRSNRQFALKLDYLPQSLSEIVNGRRNVPVGLLEKAVQVYDFNPAYLFLGEGDMFIKGRISEVEGMKVVTVVKDSAGRSMISLVPGVAQEDYCVHLSDVDYTEKLPEIHLPILGHDPAMFRAFEVVDPHMSPIIKQGDYVVAGLVHHARWSSWIGGDNIYVIVTKKRVMIRRIVNRIIEETCIILHSEDRLQNGERLEMHEVRQIWKVRLLITENIATQSGLIKALEEQVSILKETVLGQRKEEQQDPLVR